MSIFKVLVVDDSPFMCKVFSDYISADPAFVVAGTASDGKEAIERALALAPDIITMDLEMPRMNGLEALKRLMTVRPTPVIMISAVTDNGTRDTIRALQYGAIDFIRKPDQSLRLDIRQVGEQLLEKLHIAAEMVKQGGFRMLPAFEEEADIEPGELQAEESGGGSPPTEQPATAAGRSDSMTKTEPKTVPEPKPEVEPAPPSGRGSAGKPAAAAERYRKPEAPAPSDSPAARKTTKVASDKARQEAVRRPSPEQAKAPPSPEPAIKPTKASMQGKVPVPPAADKAATEPGKQLREQQAAREVTRREPVAARESAAAREPDSGKKPAGNSMFGHLVAIGTSTGGPRALHEVLTKLPANFPAPILVVQHMPPKFTKSLAQRLDSFSAIRVCEAQDGDSLVAGTAYIAPGGKHMTLARSSSSSYRIVLTDEEPRSGHKPSVDRLFESLLGLPNLKRHIVLMTGMGSDGAKGMKALRDDGAETTIAEAEQTCIVYGMPRSAVELGAASQVLELQRIAPALVQEVIALKS